MKRKATRAIPLLVAALGLALAFSMSVPDARAEANAKADEAYQISYEAYLYLYPLVLMDTTRRQMTNIQAGKAVGRGPMNMFTHVRRYPPAAFRDVVRPNFDTLYSLAWLDLTKGPMVVSVPDTKGRYYMLPMLDMWTNVFANPGSRSTGTGAGHFALVPPGWSGTLPKGMVQIEATTRMVWIIGRTQTNGAKDYPAVHKIQNGYKLTPLADWGKGMPRAVKAKIDPNVDMKSPPMIQVDKMTPGDFFTYGLALMKTNPPQKTDFDRLARMRRIGMVPGQRFDLNMAAPAVRMAIEKGARDAPKAMLEKTKTFAPKINGWQFPIESVGVYGTSYLRRAAIAMFGLGANKPQDAVYPLTSFDGKGRLLVGANNYVVRFEAGKLPPVNAFWSVTLYDKDGFPVPNRMKRHAMGDRDKLKFGKDKSLTIYLQATSPGKDRESNWLPTPKSGRFTLTMRLYAPKQPVLRGKWAPPAVKRVK